ncbi:MAG: HlyD family efflux transporter periplasmic adaptor subunit [Bacteroidales bacterium]|nr:HlyD family efflux transporter periplasmic adaptor subunit [Bacteroidales bacterium]
MLPIDDIIFSDHSEPVQEILGRPPRWIIRAGITVIFVVVALLFIGSYFIKYPDVLQAPITVTTAHLPAGVMARTTGRIDTIFVKEKQSVQAGDLLAVMENAAQWQDVLWLKNNVDSAERNTSLQLGEIQSYYFAYLKAKEDYAYFLRMDYHRRKIKVLEKQIRTQKNMLQNVRKQLAVQEQQLDISREVFYMDSSLYAQDLISKLEYETARSKYLQQQQNYDNTKLGFHSEEMSILQLEQDIFDLEQACIDEENTLSLALNGAKDQLQAQLADWEKAYLLYAPCNGIATFTKYWQRNQNVSAGEILVTVVPQEQSHIIGKILLPPQGAGKVEVGQTVNVKLDNFPYMEYGMVKVNIQHISLVPVQLTDGNQAYMLEVEFPDKLQTTYHKDLVFSQEMTGTAEVITKDLRLLDKFLNPIRYVFQR